MLSRPSGFTRPASRITIWRPTHGGLNEEVCVAENYCMVSRCRRIVGSERELLRKTTTLGDGMGS